MVWKVTSVYTDTWLLSLSLPNVYKNELEAGAYLWLTLLLNYIYGKRQLATYIIHGLETAINNICQKNSTHKRQEINKQHAFINYVYI